MAVYTSSATAFNHVNNLNSTTMYTSQSGAAVGDQAFYPWGDAWLYWGVDGYNFASLDYYDTSTTTALAPFRVFSPNIGRWHSPDPLGGDVTNPQSLNLYAYVANNPTTSIDPLGLDPCTNANTGPGGSYACSPQHAAESNEAPGGGGAITGGVPIAGPSEFGIWDLLVAELSYDPHGDDYYVDLSSAGLMEPGGGGTTSTCTVDFGRTTAVGPHQATKAGAFGFPAPFGSVAIDPWALGLPTGKNKTNAMLGSNASQITFSFSPVPNLPQGFPTTLMLGDIVGGPEVRVGGSQFNGLYDFDIYRMPTNAAANAASGPVAVTVTYPSSLPINCGGPISDTPPVPPSPTAPVPAFRRDF
jgi:RHS repeat-associated protein